MAVYSVDVRDGMIQRVTEECHKVDNKRFSDRSRFRETGMGKGQPRISNDRQRRLWWLPPSSL